MEYKQKPPPPRPPKHLRRNSGFTYIPSDASAQNKDDSGESTSEAEFSWSKEEKINAAAENENTYKESASESNNDASTDKRSIAEKPGGNDLEQTSASITNVKSNPDMKETVVGDNAAGEAMLEFSDGEPFNPNGYYETDNTSPPKSPCEVAKETPTKEMLSIHSSDAKLLEDGEFVPDYEYHSSLDSRFNVSAQGSTHVCTKGSGCVTSKENKVVVVDKDDDDCKASLSSLSCTKDTSQMETNKPLDPTKPLISKLIPIEVSQQKKPNKISLLKPFSSFLSKDVDHVSNNDRKK